MYVGVCIVSDLSVCIVCGMCVYYAYECVHIPTALVRREPFLPM